MMDNFTHPSGGLQKLFYHAGYISETVFAVNLKVGGEYIVDFILKIGDNIHS